MYRHSEHQILLPGDFFLPFEGKLNEKNRWVQLAFVIPWAKVEVHYRKQLRSLNRGKKAVPIRMALGALIIQQRLNLSDRETADQIMENPYLQYFIGLPGFQFEAPFHHSLMTYFRKRLNADVILQVNEWILSVEKEGESKDQNTDDHDDGNDSDGGHTGFNATSETVLSQNSEHPTSSNTTVNMMMKNRGKLLLDATCAPADIAYPTDLNLLNDAREKLELMIDFLHEPDQGEKKKPRTYREKARREYLSVAKQRKKGAKTWRKAVGRQLRYVERDLRILEFYRDRLKLLPSWLYRELLVIQELYRQQKEMYAKKNLRIEDRIVSISQPHVRPIVRGKARANVEFGAKLAISVVDGNVRIERLSWDSFNEGLTLQEAVERYRERYGVYPEAVLADKIYRNRVNLKYCREHNIRLSGPPLGRPPKEEVAERKREARLDASARNAVEGKFGEGKRKYGLGLIRAKLAKTSETVIALQVLVMNLEKQLRLLYAFLWIRKTNGMNILILA